MAASIREVITTCLGRTGVLSLKTDLFGIHDRGWQDRSVLAQVDLIRHYPFVRVAIVTVGISASTPAILIQRDLDAANEVFQRYCGAWVYGVASIAVTTDILGTNGVIDQDDCTQGGGFLWFGGHSVSDEEEALFDIGRNLGAEVVCYYIQGSPTPTTGGCAAHPDGKPGFWVRTNTFRSRHTFAHELAHVLGLAHVDDAANLMHNHGAGTELSEGQCWRMFGEGTYSRPYIERCGD